MSAAEAAPPVSRKARILRRTAVGLALAAAVVAMLLLASLSQSGWIVIGTGLALSALGCLELARMGSFARRGWAFVLAPCWLLVLGLAWHTLNWAVILRTTYDSTLDRTRALNQAYEPDLPLEFVCVASMAVVLRVVADGLGRRKPLRSLLALGLLLWTGWWVWLFLSPADDAFGLDDSDGGTFGLAAALLLPALVGLAWTAWWNRGGVGNLVRAAWIAPLLVLPLPWMWHVWQRFDHGGLAALIVLAKVGDIAGYYVGSAIGKRHPFPRISPGKTVAGCWGSFLVGTAAGGGLVAVGLLPDGRLGVAGGLLAGAATNLAAQAGDLLESWIKRRAGVKDSGPWFGPAGGILDLVDSLLLAVPISLLVWPWCLS